ncbi:anthranilate phosphoribosyltransferase [Fructobacillus pseudoficulneus]|uniref:anthranilate phosphoribosyltransferase n=1 Tax=Fructobacillus pseudoficulneus TaxID=220714 RepID=UPI0008A73071|nr:anthranilate phosphoribosyltransferase [Fructobacillus pseudoficulneus]SEH37278.1 anthranilate phosphoribosyltransferase [Fructobacillus pseudoficulneus]
MIETAIKNVTEGQDLSAAEASTIVEEIMTGKAQDIQIAALLTALSSKGETAAEIAGAARAMRAAAVAFPSQPQALDIVGTGGDHSNSFNISSTAALVIASLGYDVVKHGNRAASSKSGAADVLEALGFPINQSVAESEAMLAKYHFTFLFAQQYHQAMKYVAPVRKALGIRTIFNLLGPIANPAGPKKVVLGVYDASLLEPMAQVLHQLGVESANVIYGTDGMDEASIAAPTKVVQLRGDQITYQTIRPADFGLQEADKAEIIGGTAAENAAITQAVLAGEAGAPRDIVVLNAALGLNVLDEQISLQEGVRLAQEAIDSGKAEALLDNLVAGVELAL